MHVIPCFIDCNKSSEYTDVTNISTINLVVALLVRAYSYAMESINWPWNISIGTKNNKT